MPYTNDVAIARASWRGRIVFAVILAAMLLSAPRLIVYDRSYQIGGTSVSLVSVTAEGARAPLETPQSLQDVTAGVRLTQERVRDFAGTLGGRAITPHGGRLEWTLHYVVRRRAVPVRLTRTVITTVADAR